MTKGDGIDWGEWHRLDPVQSKKPGQGPSVSLTAGRHGLLVCFNSAAATEFALEKGQACDVFEGSGSKCGWLLVRKNAKGIFSLGGGLKGAVRLTRFKPEWLPEFPQPKAFCKVERAGPDAVAIELPAWFDRALRASEQSELAA